LSARVKCIAVFVHASSVYYNRLQHLQSLAWNRFGGLTVVYSAENGEAQYPTSQQQEDSTHDKKDDLDYSCTRCRTNRGLVHDRKHYEIYQRKNQAPSPDTQKRCLIRSEIQRFLDDLSKNNGMVSRPENVRAVDLNRIKAKSRRLIWKSCDL